MSMQLIGSTQRIGTGPFGFLFDPVALCDLAGRMALFHVAMAGVVIAAAVLVSLFEKARRPATV